MIDNNSFIIKLQAMLDKVKSIANIKADIKAIESKLSKVKFQGKLDGTATQKDINSRIKSIKPTIKLDADTKQAEQKIKKSSKQKTEAIIQTKTDSSQVVSSIKDAQKETKTLWDRFIGGIAGISLIEIGMQKIVKALHQAIVNIKELDAIKTNIQMVSGTSDSGADAMMSSYNAMAKSLSSTTKEVAEAANEFLRMGESLEDTNELIKSSQILSKVGMIESADAASYLISSLKGYKIAAEDSIGVVSKLTSVDLEAAVSAGGLAEAISRCSNIANSSGTSLDRLIGYTAAVGEVTQESMSVVGNAFKSIYSRMNNIKIGRFIDEETGESLSDTEAVLKKLGIQLRDTSDSYRNFDDVLNDIGTRWKDFTQVERNAISVAVAGTMQRNRFLALMDNWTKALEYSEVATNSAGSALERYGVYQDSIEAKTNELTAALESLSTNTISEELYSGIIEATTGIVEFIDKTNLLKVSFAGLAAMKISKVITSIGAGFITAAKSTAQLSAAMALFDKGTSVNNLKKIGQACVGLSDNQLKLVLSTKGLKYEQQKQILLNKGVAESEIETTLTTLGFAAAEDKATVSTFSLRGAARSLWTVITANPIGAIVTAVSVAATVFTGFSSAMEEARQRAEELTEEFKSTKSDIEDYKSKINDLYKIINDSGASISDVTEARKNLMVVQDELIKKFGAEKETIEIITDAINNQSDALDSLTKKQYLQWKNNFNDKSFMESVGDFFSSNNIEDSFYKLTELDFSGAWEALVRPTQTNIGKMVSSMQYAYYKLEKTGNSTLDSLIAKTYNLGGDGHNFVLRGNLNDVYETLLGIQELASGFNVSASFKSSATKLANSMDKTLKSYKDSYDIYVLYEKILNNSKDNPYDEQFNLINKTKEKYDEALMLGDADKLKEAADEYAQTLQSAIGLAISNNDQDVADYFKSMYPELQRMFGEWQFSLDFEPNTNGLQDKVADAIDLVDGTSDGAASFSVEDIKDFNFDIATQEQIDAYGELSNVAESYGLTIGQLIEKLRTMGLVQSENYQQLVDVFGQDNISRLSPDDLEIAYTIKNIGNMTFDQLLAEIEKTKKIIDDPISFSNIFALESAGDTLSALGKISESIDTIQNAYKTLSDAIDEYNDEGAFSIDTLQSVIALGDDWLDYLVDEEGALKLDKESLEQLTLSRLNDMRVQAINNVIGNVSKIESDAAANDYLKSTNYALAESYEKLAEAKLEDARASMQAAVAAGELSQSNMDAAYSKAIADIAKINKLFRSTDVSAWSITGKSKSSSSSKSSKQTAETFNWIETALSRVQRTIKNLGNTVSATWRNWTHRNSSLVSELSEVRKEIELQQSAYEAYLKKAESVKLPENYKSLVRSGGMSVEDIVDDGLKEQIKEYKEWYEKALACKDAVSNLNDTLADLAKTRFDSISTQFNAKIQDIDHTVNLINGELEKAETQSQIAGESFYNALIDRENARLESLAREYAEKMSVLNESVSSGVIESGSEAWQEMKADIDSVAEAIQEADSQILKYEKDLKEIAKLKFDSLESQFDNALGLITAELAQVDKQVALVEEAGYKAGEAFYQALIEMEQSNVEALVSKYESLSSSLSEALNNGSIKQFDDNWYDMVGSINDVEDALLDAESALIGYGNALRQLEWDVFDRMQDSISGLTKESDFLIDLMGNNNDLYNENGTYNDRGISVQGLHAINYDTYMRQAQEYSKAIQEINEDLAADPGNMTLIDRYNELLDLQREAVLNAEEEKAAIKDLISDGYDRLLSYMDELIDARKKAMNAEKDLHDYEKTITEQTATVEKFQKLLTAYQGDDSESMKATIQKAQAGLVEAQEALQETEYEKYISDQEAMLDAFRDDMEEWVNARLDDINGLMQQAISATNANAKIISAQINGDLSKVGMTLTDNFSRIFEIDYSGGIRDIISGYYGGDGDFAAAMTTLNTAIDGIIIKSDDIKMSADGITAVLNQRFPELAAALPNLDTTNGRIVEVKGAIDLVRQAIEAINVTVANLNLSRTTSAVQANTNPPSTKPANTTTAASQTPSVSAPASPTTSKPTGSGTGNNKPAVTEAKAYTVQDADTNYIYLDKQAESTCRAYISSHNMEIASVNGNIFKVRYKHASASTKKPAPGSGYKPLNFAKPNEYAKGLPKADKDEIAVTQEDGTEVILSPYRGGILTGIKKGDTVMTQEESQRIYELSQKDPAELRELFFGRGVLEFNNMKNTMPKASAPANNVSQNNEICVNMHFPNVNTSDEVYNVIKNENRFERLILDMTSNAMLGRNKLRKFRL